MVIGGAALVIDNSKYLNQIVDFDAQARTVTLELQFRPRTAAPHAQARLADHRRILPAHAEIQFRIHAIIFLCAIVYIIPPLIYEGYNPECGHCVPVPLPLILRVI